LSWSFHVFDFEEKLYFSCLIAKNPIMNNTPSTSVGIKSYTTAQLDYYNSHFLECFIERQEGYLLDDRIGDSDPLNEMEKAYIAANIFRSRQILESRKLLNTAAL